MEISNHIDEANMIWSNKVIYRCHLYIMIVGVWQYAYVLC